MAEKIFDFVKPGVLTGNDVQKVFAVAKKNQFALPAVNVVGTDSINAVLEAARKVNSPVIIQFSNGGASFFAGKGLSNENEKAAIVGAISGALHVHRVAEMYGVPVILHTDHAAKKLLPWIDGLLDFGENFFETHGKPLYSSHMLDLSEEPLKENVEICKKYLERMKKIGMTLEIELGITGGEEDGVDNTDVDSSRLYTQPEEETFHFLEDVLTEVMELFPSTYIHIGGDEADKANWKTCKFCQERIKREGLKNEEELQSYFTKRIEKFLNAHGRQIIGWDEILEGGISPNATVMSWRGVQGGIEAAKMGHHAIMTPGGYCYFDYYQGDPSIEPTAIGGYTTLKQVYNFEPIPSELTIEEGKFILGAQANLWSEYILDYHHAEYMLFPRLSALSEVLWSPKDKRDWGSFSKRMEEQYQRYERRDINYSLSAFQVKAHAEPDPVNRQLLITLNSEAYEPEIRYTFNGSEPDINSTLYTEPFPISTTTQLKATVFKNGVSMKQVLTEFYDLHNAFMANLTLQKEPSPRYPGSGKYTLVDGKIGTTSFTDGLWLGFSGDDMIAIIDLYKTTKITSTELYALQTEASWIFPPQWVSFETSKDGQNFVLQETVQKPKNIGKADKNILCYSTDKSVDDIRYIRVTAKNFGVCPPGHSGEGNPAWLFVSEIKIK
jgi:hexosaminidase